jgi:dimeric dUTPase (all-alpha-NTP-PPase superfamily)
MLRAMLELQDGMNRKINPQWESAGYPFLRAVLVEAVEGLDHYGWKWWKAQSADLEQLRIELIDIWHFVLSDYLVRARGDKAAAARALLQDWQGETRIAFDGRPYDVAALDVREGLELLAAMAAVRRNCMPLVAALLAACGVDAAQLFRDYVSKNVLNHFRQDNGYKTGEYRKLWDGREDNVHLAQILQGLNASDEALPQALYNSLDERYKGYLSQGKAV